LGWTRGIDYRVIADLHRSTGGFVLGALLAVFAFIASNGLAAGAGAAPLVPLCSPQNTGRFVFNPRPGTGVNPLAGATFFVDGPGRNRGMAAAAIAQQIGRDPDSFGNVTWADFVSQVTASRPAAAVNRRVHLLEKIGSQPEVKIFSRYSAGGGPGAIYSQVQKFLCRMQAVNPKADALIATSFLNHSGNCLTLRDTGSDATAFKRQIDELGAAVGDFPAGILVETDAITTAACLSPAGLQDREGLLAYAINKLSKLHHSVVYVEGGTEDQNSPQFAAHLLNMIGIGKIRGFFVNDTHFNWTADEITYGRKVSQLTGASHFIVGTQENGRGPRFLPQRIEDVCNPPGRGLGPRPATTTGYSSAHVDGFMWLRVPGRSSGHCHPGDAPAESFDTKIALDLARNANSRLGPRFPSRPY
jgi:hypothetical protein